MEAFAADIFRPLLVEDADLRANSLNQVLQRLYELEIQDRDKLIALLPVTVRVTCESPFSDVVEALSAHLAHLHEDLGIDIPEVPTTVSKFFSEPEIPLPCRTENAEVSGLFVKSFLSSGRVSHHVQILSLHPSYLKLWLETMDVLLYQDAPLPKTWRHYIAMISAARFHCSYVIQRQKQLFLSEGGDIAWVHGLQNAPPKIRALAELNALLAHRPWKISAKHIHVLIEGGQVVASEATTTDSIPPPQSRNSRRRWIRSRLQNHLETIEPTSNIPVTRSGSEASDDQGSEVVTLNAAADHLLNGDEVLNKSRLSSKDMDRLRNTILRPRRHQVKTTEPAPPSELLFPSFSLSGSDTWSMNELTHAITIMVTFHAASHFVAGLGLRSECDLDVKVPSETDSESVSNDEVVGPAQSTSGSEEQQCQLDFRSDQSLISESKSRVKRPLRDKLMSGIDVDDDSCSSSTESDSTSSNSDTEYPTVTSVAEPSVTDQLSSHSSSRTENSSDQRTTCKVPRRRHMFERAGRVPGVSIYTPTSVKNPLSAWIERLHGLPLWYRDFSTHEGIFRTQDFSWEQHGFSLLSRFFPALAPCLDDQFKHTYRLTYNTLAGEGGVDTEPFRTAVWYYVHRLYGICNDDYDYSRVNRIIEVGTKTYIKKLVCAPDTISQLDFDAIEGGMQADEKVHICMLCTEAKKQACLLYALHAMMKYFT